MSNTTVTGFVAKLITKNGSTNGRDWTLHSMRMQDPKSGDEMPLYYNLGFDKPNLNEGDYIRFQAKVKSDVAADVDTSSIAHGKNPPKQPELKRKGGGGGGRKGGGGYSPPKVTESERFGKIGGYTTEDDVARISMSAAQERAARLLAVFVEADAIPMSAAKNKGGQSKRFEELVATFDKFTVKLLNDAIDFERVLSTVPDWSLLDDKPQGELPEDLDEPDAPEEQDDDFADAGDDGFEASGDEEGDDDDF